MITELWWRLVLLLPPFHHESLRRRLGERSKDINNMPGLLSYGLNGPHFFGVALPEVATLLERLPRVSLEYRVICVHEINITASIFFGVQVDLIVTYKRRYSELNDTVYDSGGGTRSTTKVSASSVTDPVNVICEIILPINLSGCSRTERIVYICNHENHYIIIFILGACDIHLQHVIC